MLVYDFFTMRWYFINEPRRHEGHEETLGKIKKRKTSEDFYIGRGRALMNAEKSKEIHEEPPRLQEHQGKPGKILKMNLEERGFEQGGCLDRKTLWDNQNSDYSSIRP
jgi:hypothetical protein